MTGEARPALKFTAPRSSDSLVINLNTSSLEPKTTYTLIMTGNMAFGVNHLTCCGTFTKYEELRISKTVNMHQFVTNNAPATIRLYFDSFTGIGQTFVHSFTVAFHGAVGFAHSVHNTHLANTAKKSLQCNFVFQTPYVKPTFWGNDYLRLLNVYSIEGEEREIITFAPETVTFIGIDQPSKEKQLDISVMELRGEVTHEIDILSGSTGILMAIRKKEKYVHFLVNCPHFG